MKNNHSQSDLNRRQFLRGGSFSTLMAMMGGVAVKAKAQDKPKEEDAATNYKATGAPVKIGLIGCGAWGRGILKTLAILPNAPVVAVCDNHAVSLRRAKASAPNAETYEDYKKLLENKEVQGVIVATPTHFHREIVLAALQAGKHVYCEVPFAANVEDARAIAQAAQAAVKVNFQSGLQIRSDPQRLFLLQFIRSGAMGKTIKARAQWQRKQTWRFSSQDPQREKDLNWRLQKANSLGLIGELGIHQVDAAISFINVLPTAITGFGGILLHNDGREIPDTIQAVFEFPGKVLLSYEATIASSFDADYELYYGTDSTIMVRDNKAWMFKEVDAPLLGWEVFANKDSFYKETGISLVADASKSVRTASAVTEEIDYAETSLRHALQSFVTNSNMHAAEVKNFSENFDANDIAALREYLESVNKIKQPHAGYKEGFQATVAVLKANEAILKGQKLPFPKDWFDLG